jgi:hypothetical protein
MMYTIELTPEFHRIGLLIAVASSKERMAATGIIVGLLYAEIKLKSEVACSVLRL